MPGFTSGVAAGTIVSPAMIGRGYRGTYGGA